MLRYFFERGDENEDLEKREALFDGLQISDTDEFRSYFAKYPVIFLTFKDIKKKDFNSALFSFRLTIQDEFQRHLNLLDNPLSSAGHNSIARKILQG